MREQSGWNLSLGRLAGVRVKLHVSFILLAVFLVYLATREPNPPTEAPWAALAVCGLLFVSAVLHELGHCLVAWRLGGSTDQMLLYPLGGLGDGNSETEPQDEMRVAMAGPMVNLLVCLLLLPVLVWQRVDVLGLFNVFAPPSMIDALAWPSGPLRCAFYLNWLLALVNLLPSAPLDGGRILRAALTPSVGHTQATVIEVWVGYFTALLLPLVAWMLGLFDGRPYLWGPVVVLSIFLYFSGKQLLERVAEPEQEDAGAFGYDFSQGYTSLEQRLAAPSRRKGFLRRWLDERRRLRERRQLEQELAEEQRMDAILVRLSEVGMNGLSAEERDVLTRVSRRLRNRTRHE